MFTTKGACIQLVLMALCQNWTCSLAPDQQLVATPLFELSDDADGFNDNDGPGFRRESRLSSIYAPISAAANDDENEDDDELGTFGKWPNPFKHYKRHAGPKPPKTVGVGISRSNCNVRCCPYRVVCNEHLLMP